MEKDELKNPDKSKLEIIIENFRLHGFFWKENIDKFLVLLICQKLNFFAWYLSRRNQVCRKMSFSIGIKHY